MDPNTQIIRNTQVIAKRINGEFIVLNANKGNLYKLNDTAQLIWRSAKMKKTITEIAAIIQENFSVDKTKAEKEVSNFIQKHLNSLFLIVEK